MVVEGVASLTKYVQLLAFSIILTFYSTKDILSFTFRDPFLYFPWLSFYRFRWIPWIVITALERYLPRILFAAVSDERETLGREDIFSEVVDAAFCTGLHWGEQRIHLQTFSDVIHCLICFPSFLRRDLQFSSPVLLTAALQTIGARLVICASGLTVLTDLDRARI